MAAAALAGGVRVSYPRLALLGVVIGSSIEALLVFSGYCT